MDTEPVFAKARAYLSKATRPEIVEAADSHLHRPPSALLHKHFTCARDQFMFIIFSHSPFSTKHLIEATMSRGCISAFVVVSSGSERSSQARAQPVHRGQLTGDDLVRALEELYVKYRLGEEKRDAEERRRRVETDLAPRVVCSEAVR